VPFKKRDTVAGETPAASATSCKVVVLLSFFIGVRRFAVALTISPPRRAGAEMPDQGDAAADDEHAMKTFHKIIALAYFYNMRIFRLTSATNEIYHENVFTKYEIVFK
jgi:hypothetical protein